MRVQKSTMKRYTAFLSILFVAIVLSVSANTAEAATYTVTNTNDNGAGSLRDAIAQANANAGGDTIVFDAGVFATPQTITLTSGELAISDDLTINGTGASRLTISGNHTSRVFSITSGRTVMLGALTITGGRVTNAFGGGILNHGTLVVFDCILSDNETNSGGGGIFSNGALTINTSILSGNSAIFGGGIAVGGTATVNGTTVSGNTALKSNSGFGDGGGIDNDGAILNVNNSTVSGNSADSNGGGIANDGTTTVYNSTLSDNHSSSIGGGVWSNRDRILTIGNSTITANTAEIGGGGIANSDFVTLKLYSSIVANNTFQGSDDILGTVTSGDHNLIGIDPKLGPLQFNGGPTMTHALLPGSPAIDAGVANGQTTDQRGAGFSRTYDNPDKINASGGDGTDIGAFEVQQPCSSCSFAAAMNFGSGDGPDSVTTGDFNHDGILDLAAANISSDDISVLLGDGAGGFGPATSFGVASHPESVTTGDFNGDGKLDLATVNSSFVSVLLGDGAGGFAPAANIGVGTDPRSVTTGDFNGDGKLDLASANLGDNNVSVLLGDGAGGFAPAANFGVGAGPFSVTLGDFNGDGKLDLVTSNAISNNVSVLLGDGAGGFAPAANFGVGTHPHSVTTGDFNGDGNLDIAAANLDSGNVSVLLGDGAGGFALAANFGVGTDPFSVTFGDFNGDGRLDLASANAGSNNVSVLLNNCMSNTAPVAKDDSYSTNEDTPLSVSASGVLGNDTDAESDALTVALVAGPSHAQSFTLNADGSFSYTPNANFNGTDSFTYKANDGKLDSNVATVTITVNPVNDAPVVSASPKTQSNVQYSDPVSTVTINASDVETPASALTVAFSYSKDGAASVAGLPAGMVQGGTAGAWTVSGVAGVPQGTYVITATVTDTGDGSAAAVSSSDTFTIVVTPENAIAAPKLSNPVSMQVSSPGGTATGFTDPICFDISEISDGSPGNISLAGVFSPSLSLVGGGSFSSYTLQTYPLVSGGPNIITACYRFGFASAPVGVYEIKVTVGGGYYTGTGTTVFTIFDPSAGFASGGGWIINPNNGNRANYGVNVKYLKNGNYQGSVLYVEHRPDGDYKIKSTSLNSTGGFAIIPITGGAEADIAGKANYGVNDVFTGNYSFIARVLDKGTPGTNDQFGLKLINPSGQTVADFYFGPVTLGGGNNQVPKK